MQLGLKREATVLIRELQEHLLDVVALGDVEREAVQLAAAVLREARLAAPVPQHGERHATVRLALALAGRA